MKFGNMEAKQFFFQQQTHTCNHNKAWNCSLYNVFLNPVKEDEPFVNPRHDLICWIDVNAHSCSSSNPQRLGLYLPVCHLQLKWCMMGCYPQLERPEILSTKKKPGPMKNGPDGSFDSKESRLNWTKKKKKIVWLFNENGSCVSECALLWVLCCKKVKCCFVLCCRYVLCVCCWLHLNVMVSFLFYIFIFVPMCRPALSAPCERCIFLLLILQCRLLVLSPTL